MDFQNISEQDWRPLYTRFYPSLLGQINGIFIPA